MIILTDGQTSGEGYDKLAHEYRKQGITVSTVAVGDDADINLLKRMASEGGGTFYHAKSPRMLPRIFQKEARMVSRPLIFEREAGMSPRIKFPHEILRGIEGAPPPITGFVLTDVKHNPLVEVALASPQPTEPEYQTLLASWTYGLGKAVAFTTDVSGRWTGAWAQWPMRDKLFSQMVRWSMRPVDNQANFTVSTDVRNGKAEVIIDALDRQQMFLDGLTMTARVVGQDLKPRDLAIRQVGPGRYVGEVQMDEAGAYLVSVVPGAGAAPLISGLNVPYSKEYLDRESNEPLLTSLSRLEPKGGDPGMLIDDPQGAGSRRRSPVPARSLGPPAVAPMGWKNCWRSTPSVTPCREPRRGKISGRNCCWLPAACSSPMCLCGECRSASPGFRWACAGPRPAAPSREPRRHCRRPSAGSKAARRKSSKRSTPAANRPASSLRRKSLWRRETSRWKKSTRQPTVRFRKSQSNRNSLRSPKNRPTTTPAACSKPRKRFGKIAGAD